MTPLETVQRFVEHINHHDIAAATSVMTPDHRFIDSLGSVVAGRDQVRDAWQRYFGMVPDYRIAVEHSFTDGPTVVVLGTASGTYRPDGTGDSANTWQTPAAWRSVVRGGLVAEWQVYADNEPMRQQMRRASV